MNHFSLEAEQLVLSALRVTRDRWTLVVVIGIIAEVIVEAIWLQRSSPVNVLAEPKPTRPFAAWHFPLLSGKGALIFVAGIVTAISLYKEWSGGQAVDAKADKIQAVLQSQLRDAIAEQTRLERLIGGRSIIQDAALIRFLKDVPITPLWVRSLGEPTFTNSPASIVDAENIVRVYTESNDFARSFVILRPALGWEFHTIRTPIVAGPDRSGVHVYSHKVPNTPTGWPLDTSPDSPEKDAWIAAEALTEYLQSDLGLTLAVHWPLDLDTDCSECAAIPPNGILVAVGEANLSEELRQRLREEEWKKP